MKPEHIILRTKNAGDILIYRSYLLIYEAIDKLVSAKRRLFSSIDDKGAKQLFKDIEEQTFGDWYCSTPVFDITVHNGRIPVIEARD